MKVTNANGCIKLSNVVTVTVPCREGEGEGESKSEFSVRVFPNPSSGDFVFEISNSNSEKVSIRVFDLIGKLVLSERNNNSQFTISFRYLFC